MKMFHWYSDALYECTHGDIIVHAETVDEAREKVRDALRLLQWWTDETKARVLVDIAPEPQVREVLFIEGRG